MSDPGRESPGHEFGSGVLSRCSKCGSIRSRKGYGWIFAMSMEGPWETVPPVCAPAAPKNPWRAREIVFFDVETTGLDWRASVITEIAFVRGKVLDSGDVEVIDKFQSLVFVTDEFLAQAEETSKITGITLDDLREAPVVEAVLVAIQSFLSKANEGALIASYNAGFDVPFLGSTYLRAGLPMPKILLNEVVLDPLVWSRKIDKYEKGGHKLGNVALKKGLVDEDALESAHRADFDAELGLRVLGHFAKSVPQDLEELWHWQRAARGEWESSFFSFLLKKTKESPKTNSD